MYQSSVATEIVFTNRKGATFLELAKEKILLSEVGFEPTPTDVDYDLNVAP